MISENRDYCIVYCLLYRYYTFFCRATFIYFYLLAVIICIFVVLTVNYILSILIIIGIFVHYVKQIFIFHPFYIPN